MGPRPRVVFVTVFSGAVTLGSAFWGQLAGWAGVPVALSIAAAAQLLTIPLTWRYKLQLGDALDLAPSMHWPTPVVSGKVEDDAGPVLVTVDYRVDAAHRDAFLDALHGLSRQRRRDGAYAWGVFESTNEAAATSKRSSSSRGSSTCANMSVLRKPIAYARKNCANSYVACQR